MIDNCKSEWKIINLVALEAIKRNEDSVWYECLKCPFCDWKHCRTKKDGKITQFDFVKCRHPRLADEYKHERWTDKKLPKWCPLREFMVIW